MAEEEAESRATIEAQLTRESLQRGFIEYPKMLFHTDGSNVIVTGKKEEESKLADGYHPTPEDAQNEKARRDEADRKRSAVAIGEEAVESGKAPKK